MQKSPPLACCTPRYALSTLNWQEECMNGSASTRDWDGTLRFAHSILRSYPGAAFIEIHQFGASLDAPLRTVSLDDFIEEK